MVPSNAGLVGTLSGSDVTTIAEVLTNNTNTVQTATYTVTPKSGDCEGEDFEIVVTVNPVAVVTAAPNPEVICSGSNTSITLTPASTGTVGMTYSWSATVTTGSNATISGFSQQTTPSSLNQINHTLVNTGTSPGVVTYIVTPHFGTCAGTPISIPVTVNPLGQVDQEDDQVICQGETTQAVVFSTINTVGTTTYAWQIDKNIGLTSLSGTGNFPAFIAVNTTLEAIVATVTVTPTFDYQGKQCFGPAKTFKITVNPVAQVIATPSSEVICAGEETSIQLSSTASGSLVTYSWVAVESQAPTGGEITGFTNHTAKTLAEIKQTLTNTGTSPGKVKYTVTPHIGNCPGIPLEIEITVNPIPQVNNVTDQIRCAGEQTALITFGTANSGGTTTYAWQMNTNIGTGLNGTGNNLAAFTTVNNTNAPVIATVTVTPTFTIGGVSCTGPPEIFTITVNPAPVIADKTPLPICSGSCSRWRHRPYRDNLHLDNTNTKQ